MQPRALDCIYLRTPSLIYGKHKLFHISTKRVNTRKHCTSAVINQYIIDQLHQIADDEKINKTNINNEMSDPSFAGVYLTNSDSGHMDEQVDTNMIKETLHEPNISLTPNSNNTTSFTNKLITKNDMESDAISEETNIH